MVSCEVSILQCFAESSDCAIRPLLLAGGSSEVQTALQHAIPAAGVAI